ncbi:MULTISPECIES: hypothetical protein [Vibrio]|uniref:Uncharacterized protein n=2 Tax=Vibrio TaxID=662 RepID=A0A7X4LHG9_9VIBR|nr:MULTISPECIES: hypothetical protein [Vibrio]MBF9003259.1 hypothetical protein [Vibrio nitrifigilis]MZI91982.1 hypothetical protein [Vibrio eleionomae]
MDLQQCWSSFLKAEQLLQDGHWPQAHYLLEDILHDLPGHINQAATDDHTKPCQFSCLIAGLRDTTVYQSEILNNMGQQQRAFEALNQSYALLQFLSIEDSDLIRSVSKVLEKHSEDLLHHMGAFCHAQRNAQWQLEYEQVEKAHHHFSQLKRLNDLQPNAVVMN